MSANQAPVDLAAVQADDALLDMLGVRGGVDAELVRVLVEAGTALAAIAAARLLSTTTKEMTHVPCPDLADPARHRHRASRRRTARR